jgi:hypothetical protein
MILSAN